MPDTKVKPSKDLVCIAAYFIPSVQDRHDYAVLLRKTDELLAQQFASLPTDLCLLHAVIPWSCHITVSFDA